VASAGSAVTVMNVLSVACVRSIRCRQARVRSTGDAALRRSNSDACWSDKLVRSDGAEAGAAKAGFRARLAAAVAAVKRKSLRLGGVAAW
jgi:hypothetical protein